VQVVCYVYVVIIVPLCA